MKQSCDSTYAWVKVNAPQLKISTKGSKRVYGKKAQEVYNLAKYFKRANVLFTGITISEDINGMQSTEDAEMQAKYFMDAYVNALGFIPGVSERQLPSSCPQWG